MSQIVKGCRALVPAGVLIWDGPDPTINATYPVSVTVVDIITDFFGDIAVIETIWKERYHCYVHDLKFLSMPKPPSLSEIMKSSVK